MGNLRDRQELLDNVDRIVGDRESLDEFWRVDEGKVALLLGKGVGVYVIVIEKVGE